nr:3D domain-containing protein [Clostridium celatum]
MFFLFKKIISLTTSLAISILGINEFCASASMLIDSNNKVVNSNYIKINDNKSDLSKELSSITNSNILLDNSIDNTVKNTSTQTIVPTFENILQDVNNYELNKNIDNSQTEENVNRAIDENTDTSISNNTEVSENNISPYKATYTMEATAYTGGDYTAMGLKPTRNPNGLSTIAVDPSIIPLGSKVYIPGYGEAIASDTGSAINGYIVDLYLNSYDECVSWGRQYVTVNILAYPGEW